jgi:hypothetical protein
MLIIGALLGIVALRPRPATPIWADHPLKSAADRISELVEQYLGAIDVERPEPLEKATIEHAPAARPEYDSVLGTVVRTRWLDTPAAAGTAWAHRWHAPNLSLDGHWSGVPQDRAACRLRGKSDGAWKAAHIEEQEAALAARTRPSPASFDPEFDVQRCSIRS